jgi:uncharacterized membrane protein
MRSEIINDNQENDIENVLLEENYYNNKDKQLYLKTKNNVILFDFFYKLVFYIATGMLILVDIYIIAYFLTDNNNDFLKQEYSYEIKINLIISFILYTISLLIYMIYKKTSERFLRFFKN